MSALFSSTDIEFSSARQARGSLTASRSAAGGAGPLERRVMRPYSTRGHASGKPLIAGPHTPRRILRWPVLMLAPRAFPCTLGVARPSVSGTTDEYDSQLFGTFT